MVARLVSQQPRSGAKDVEDSWRATGKSPVYPWNPEDGTDGLTSENEDKQTRETKTFQLPPPLLGRPPTLRVRLPASCRLVKAIPRRGAQQLAF